MASKAETELNALNKSSEITLIKYVMFNNKTLVRFTAKTFNENGECDNVDIFFKEDKNRRQKTYENAGVTKEQVKNGIEIDAGMRQISDYFIKHDGVITGFETKRIVSKVNKKIEELEMKAISAHIIELEKEAKYCDVTCNRIDTFEYMMSFLKKCMKKYESIVNSENNKYECKVNYAYYMESNYGSLRRYIYCITSIGRIIYDIDNDKWKVTQKDKNQTGLRIENFDIESVKVQLKEKYNVINMSNLAEELKKIEEEKRQYAV